MRKWCVKSTVYVWAEDEQAAVERTGAALDNYSLEDNTTLLHGVDAYVSVTEAK